MSNSIMERICEARVREGLPGLAVQWGTVGDVGMMTEKQEKQASVMRGQLCLGNSFIFVDHFSLPQTLDT
jgi:fatty acid synthase